MSPGDFHHLAWADSRWAVALLVVRPDVERTLKLDTAQRAFAAQHVPEAVDLNSKRLDARGVGRAEQWVHG